MYDPFCDYFGLNELVTRTLDQTSSSIRNHGRGFLFENDFHTNGVNVPMVPLTSPSTNDANNNNTMLPGSGTGFLPLPLKLSDITEFSKVMQNRGKNRNGRGGTGVSSSGRPPSWCVFCKNNGESELVYASHKLKSDEGLTTCPILRAYTCPLCGTNGDRAHTIKYCPLNKEEGSSASPGTIGSQYRTPRTSTGRRRTSSLSGGSGGGPY